MKTANILTVLMIISSLVFSQKYITKNGHIKFYSETPAETIEAHNQQVNSALDISSGDFVFKVLMKSFEFEKALMQEHFNENYVESDKFPNATFKGKVLNINRLDFEEEKTMDIEVEGELTIHGITQKIKAKGSFSVTNNRIEANSSFYIDPADYVIKIPNTVIGNIAEQIEVTVAVTLDKYVK